MSKFTPWANSRNMPEIATPEYPDLNMARYASPTPGSTQQDYPLSPLGWSPTPAKEPGNTPDPARLGLLPLYQTDPGADQPPEEFYRPLDADKSSRLRDTETIGTAWPTVRGMDSGPRFAPNPRATPPPENRVTQRLSPANYSFWRPFMTNQPKMGDRHLNGLHFSMAAARRNYTPPGGMAPQRQPGNGTRNTYRLDPAPWDINVVDMPQPVTVGLPQEQSQTGYEVSRPASGNGWRLS